MFTFTSLLLETSVGCPSEFRRVVPLLKFINVSNLYKIKRCNGMIDPVDQTLEMESLNRI